MQTTISYKTANGRKGCVICQAKGIELSYNTHQALHAHRVKYHPETIKQAPIIKTTVTINRKPPPTPTPTPTPVQVQAQVQVQPQPQPQASANLLSKEALFDLVEKQVIEFATASRIMKALKNDFSVNVLFDLVESEVIDFPTASRIKKALLVAPKADSDSEEEEEPEPEICINNDLDAQVLFTGEIIEKINTNIHNYMFRLASHGVVELALELFGDSVTYILNQGLVVDGITINNDNAMNKFIGSVLKNLCTFIHNEACKIQVNVCKWEEKQGLMEEIITDNEARRRTSLKKLISQQVKELQRELDEEEIEACKDWVIKKHPIQEVYPGIKEPTKEHYLLRDDESIAGYTKYLAPIDDAVVNKLKRKLIESAQTN